jgi:hypothetical protein
LLSDGHAAWQTNALIGGIKLESHNPYQSPSSELPVVADPLQLPAIGCVLSSVFGFGWAMWMLYVCIKMLNLARDIAQAGLEQEAREGVYTAGVLGAIVKSCG